MLIRARVEEREGTAVDGATVARCKKQVKQKLSPFLGLNLIVKQRIAQAGRCLARSCLNIVLICSLRRENKVRKCARHSE